MSKNYVDGRGFGEGMGDVYGGGLGNGALAGYRGGHGYANRHGYASGDGNGNGSEFGMDHAHFIIFTATSGAGSTYPHCLIIR